MSPRESSHLSEASAAGKKYDWKGTCDWCYAHYDKDLSDSLQPEIYCSLRCETEDAYTT